MYTARQDFPHRIRDAWIKMNPSVSKRLQWDWPYSAIVGIRSLLGCINIYSASGIVLKDGLCRRRSKNMVPLSTYGVSVRICSSWSSIVERSQAYEAEVGKKGKRLCRALVELDAVYKRVAFLLARKLLSLSRARPVLSTPQITESLYRPFYRTIFSSIYSSWSLLHGQPGRPSSWALLLFPLAQLRVSSGPQYFTGKHDLPT